jgi:hypothetical protein
MPSPRCPESRALPFVSLFCLPGDAWNEGRGPVGRNVITMARVVSPADEDGTWLLSIQLYRKLFTPDL